MSLSGKLRRNLTAALVICSAAATVLLPASSAAATTPLVSVDLSAGTGPVLHGGNGSLYGLSDDGVPSDNLLAPLKITTVAQKPPAGLQHPNGDTLAVADSFRRNGGGDIYVYLQDVYQQWPYENLGLADYLSKIDTMTTALVASSQRAHFVYVPFNEPDNIWYGLGTSDPAAYATARDRFFADWKTVYQRIRAIDPGARIAGPNEANYDPRFLADFLPWSRANGVLPAVTTWHELNPNSLKNYRSNYAQYRSFEQANGITPRPINIDEYADRRDLSVPGQLVQWVSMFEDTKVYADQAYWDIAGNLDGNAARNNVPNGSWWFFHWYAAMSGNTVELTPPQANVVDTLQGLASYDTSRRQAQVLLGGADGAADVAVRHVDRSVFGSRVTVTVSEAAWSGYDGASAPPKTLSRKSYPVAADGTVTVPLTAMNKMSAYQLLLTPAAAPPAAVNPPWTASYEAESGAITDGTVYTQGTVDNPYGYATSGTRDVGSLNQATSKVDFTVNVPATGAYRLGVLYGNQTGSPSQQVLRIDGAAPRLLDYPSTLNWTYRGRVDTAVTLSAGTHTLTLAASDPTLGRARGEATLDRVDLTAAGNEDTSYPATTAETSGSARDIYPANGSPAGSVVLSNGGRVTFDVYAATDGYYPVRVDHDGCGSLFAGTDRAGALAAGRGAVTTTRRVYLLVGINRLSVTGDGPAPLTVAGLHVGTRPDTAGVQTYEAENAQLSGTTVVSANPFASGGKQVSDLGNGAGNTLTFAGLQAATAGRYYVVVHYANNERSGTGNYNTNVVSRFTDVSVNGGASQRVAYRNTYGWNDFWTTGFAVTLPAGISAIRFANSTAYGPDVDRIEVARLS